MADVRWRLAPGNPWRVTRDAVVVATASGTALVEGPTAAVLLALPASAAEVAEAVPQLGAADVEDVLAALHGEGLTVPV